MKRSLGLISLAVSLWSSLSWGLSCSSKEYPLSNKKCCKYCPAGEELVKRCTVSSPTKCEACDENYYNDVYTHSRCKPCTECNTDRGLKEIRPCQRTSNTICTCLPGHAPEDREGEKTSGSKTLRPGKRDEDAICDTPSSKIPTKGTITQPTPLPKTRVFTMQLDSSPTVVPTNPGFVWILITFVLLLTVAGALVLLFCYRRVKKKKLDILCNVIYPIPCKDLGLERKKKKKERDGGRKEREK
ncbi:hypothetical protein E2320_006257 [Naja naja]|nr:hypothetical protein E2320_006257 [Naja naja]